MSVTLSPLSPEGELNIGPHRSPAEFMRDLRMAVHEKKKSTLKLSSVNYKHNCKEKCRLIFLELSN